jgi:hypothetical protein
MAQDRPPLWEYRLTEELLRTKLAALSAKDGVSSTSGLRNHAENAWETYSLLP